MAWTLVMSLLSPTCKTKTKHRGTSVGSATRLWKMKHQGGVLGPANRLGKMKPETYYPCYLLYTFGWSQSQDDRAIQSFKNVQMNVHNPRGKAAAHRDYETC